MCVYGRKVAHNIRCTRRHICTLYTHIHLPPWYSNFIYARGHTLQQPQQVGFRRCRYTDDDNDDNVRSYSSARSVVGRWNRSRGLGSRPCADQPLSATRAIDKLARYSPTPPTPRPRQSRASGRAVIATAASAAMVTHTSIRKIRTINACVWVRACV